MTYPYLYSISMTYPYLYSISMTYPYLYSTSMTYPFTYLVYTYSYAYNLLHGCNSHACTV